MKIELPNCVACVLVALLPACSVIPERGYPGLEAGHGGKAEVYQGSFLPINAHHRMSTQQALRLDWESQKHLLDLLVLQGAIRCYPASVQLAEVRQIRIVRELAGGMYADAANDLLIQRKKLAELERELNYVNQYDTCYPAPNDKAREITEAEPDHSLQEEISRLLNCDNQFAFNSANINPKYKNRLIKASALLKNVGPYQLFVSGHTDSIGLENINRELSQERADQVRQFLQSLGIPRQAIIVGAEGESKPLFNGDSPAIRLVNRRVNIRINIRAATTKTEQPGE